MMAGFLGSVTGLTERNDDTHDAYLGTMLFHHNLLDTLWT